ncbi:response regulator transcription factor [Streptomyces justiciae]|uniref:response regulator transcription factor n=1 Tax=Streptomyces justiciae TaxID=2780140 RepID=UPI002ADD3DF8|nr:response regulator transcription factor [Streptomyces justiciae]
MITVLIADPHALHRLSLRTLLTSHPGLTVVGEADSGAETARLHDVLRPQVVLLGSGLPAPEVITTVRRLRLTRVVDSGPPRVLVLSSAHGEEHAYDVLRAGADGYLPATVAPDEVISALSTVAAGDAVVPPGLARALIHAVRCGPRPEALEPKGRLEDLTERERDVLAAVAAGHSNTEIAAQLCIAPTTVKSHVSSILTKIGARARVQAVIFAYESGLVRPPRTTSADRPSGSTPHRMTHREEPTCAYFSSRTTPPSPTRWNAA